MEHPEYPKRPYVYYFLLSLSGGCAIPVPLSEQAVVGEVQVLQVRDALPPFGAQAAHGPTDPYLYQLDVVVDQPASALAGRLYLQVDGACCDLTVGDSTKFLQTADVLAADTSGGTASAYTVQFRQPVLPCTLVSHGTTAFVIPVLAAEGFLDGPTGFLPAGRGVSDSTHFWAVFCQ